MAVFHRVSLPLLWSLATIGSFKYPGDEYGMLVGGAIAGFWPLFFVPSVGHVDSVMPVVLLLGTATMLLLGWALDWARAPRLAWMLVWAALGAALCWRMLAVYPSLARAVSKNGSLAAYLFTSLNFSLYLTSLLLIPVTRLLGWHRWRPPPGRCPRCGYSLTGAPGPRCPECFEDIADLLSAGDQLPPPRNG